MGQGQQRQVDGVERQVAAEREQAHPGVAVDVAFADLDEPAAEGQQFQPGPLRGAGQGVEHDVDAVAVGVPADLVGELGAARIVDVLDSHVAQQLSTVALPAVAKISAPAARAIAMAACPTPPVAEWIKHLVAGGDPGQIVQAVPRGGVRTGHRGGPWSAARAAG